MMLERSHEDLIAQCNEIVRLADLDYPSALAAAKAFYQDALTARVPRQIALAMQTEARVLKRLADKSAAIRLQNEVIRYLKYEQLNEDLTSAYRVLGQMLYDAMAYFKSLDAWLTSLELAGLDHNVQGTTLAYIGIGKFYYALGDYTKAIYYHQLALLAAKSLNRVALNAEININIAADAFRLRDFTVVLQALDEAQKAFDSGYDRPAWLGEVVFYRGMVYFELSQFAEAQEFLSRAYSIYRKCRNSWGEGHALLALGRAFLKLEEPEHAVECLSVACEICDQNQLAALGIEANEILAYLYVDLGDNLQALHYHKRLHKLICQTQTEQRSVLRLSRRAQQRLKEIEIAFELAKLQARLTGD
ncbi:tetratricopeptide repeat protein [Deefgea tanakiae]|uniref:Tetratricopeptide repeat protein n=1 Tax=Deefgea tanakiae TaxID=2865840 RepID=A0ABX8Z4X1_9NEIS|nr:tetratricopeptide repeat protein [Deefgea tanakiae]QZA77357.1 tetratricopeptide repeat protein [Deefgea tanakiae]